MDTEETFGHLIVHQVGKTDPRVIAKLNLDIARLNVDQTKFLVRENITYKGLYEKTKDENQRLQSRILQHERGTPISEYAAYPTGQSLDDVSDSLYWKYKAEKATKQVEDMKQKMYKVVNDIIDHRFKSMMPAVEKYWFTYTGTMKAFDQHKQLASRVIGITDVTPEEQAEIDTFTGPREEFGSMLEKEIQTLDEGNTPRVPSFYSEGILITLDQWKTELVNIKEQSFQELQKKEDLTTLANCILSRYNLQEFEMKKLVDTIRLYKDDKYTEHMGMFSLLVFRLVNKPSS